MGAALVLLAAACAALAAWLVRILSAASIPTATSTDGTDAATTGVRTIPESTQHLAVLPFFLRALLTGRVSFGGALDATHVDLPALRESFTNAPAARFALDRVVSLASAAEQVATYRGICAMRESDAPLSQAPFLMPAVLGEVLGMLVVLTAPRGTLPFPTLPFPVHLRQTVELLHSKGIRADQTLRLAGRTGDVRENARGAGVETDFVVEGFDADGSGGKSGGDGKPVYRSVTTGLYRYSRSSRAKRDQGRGGAPGGATAPAASGPADGVAWLDFDAAHVRLLPCPDGRPDDSSWHVTLSMAHRYAAASDDYNPFHMFAVCGRLAGFRGAIAHGMWTLGRAIAALQARRAMPAPPCRLTAEFRTPVVLPCTVRFECAREGEGGAKAGGAVQFRVVSEDGRHTHCVARVAAL